MLVVMALPTIVACSSDDDNNDTSNYTEAEIVELLTGKWEIYGEVKVTDYETQKTITDNYKGTIELKNNNEEGKINEAISCVPETNVSCEGHKERRKNEQALMMGDYNI